MRVDSQARTRNKTAAGPACPWIGPVETAMRAWAPLLLIGSLAACGGNVEPSLTATTLDAGPVRQQYAVSASPRAIAPTAAAGAVSMRGVLLGGVPGLSARAAVRDYSERATPHAPSPGTFVSAVIGSSATVGQVNAALTQVGARIVAMQEGRSEVTLALSNAGDRAAAQHAAARLATSRAFEPYKPPAEPVDDHLQPPPADSTEAH